MDVTQDKVSDAVYPKLKQNPGSVLMFDTSAPGKSESLAVVPVGGLFNHLSLL